MQDCRKCGLCCSCLILPLAWTPSEDVIEWLTARELRPKLRNGILWIAVPDRCPHLNNDNLCEVYDDRPRICREGICLNKE